MARAKRVKLKTPDRAQNSLPEREHDGLIDSDGDQEFSEQVPKGVGSGTARGGSALAGADDAIEPDLGELEVTPEQALPELDEAIVEDTTVYLKGLIEAILFVSDKPLELKELARAVKLDRKRTLELVSELCEEYASRGIYIEEVAGGYCYRSSSRYASYVRNFLAQRPIRLTRAQLETLAIVAYRQPITRPEIDDVRGVDCGPVLKGLLDRDLIRILGKKDEAGRPMLYGTTQQFLELFNLTSLSELPTLKEFTELSDESRREFEAEVGEIAPENAGDESAQSEVGPSILPDDEPELRVSTTHSEIRDLAEPAPVNVPASSDSD